MTDYLDVSRDQSNKIFELPTKTLREELLKAFPTLQTTLYAADTSLNRGIINRSLSVLNPITFFQNEINTLTDTDYYAYKKYRDDIQVMIDKKINLILQDTWNKVSVNKEKYIQYVGSFK